MRFSFIITLALLIGACTTVAPTPADGGGGSGSGNGSGAAGAGTTSGTCDKPPLVTGVLVNDVADIDFSGEAVQASVAHKLDIDVEEDGCVVRLGLSVKKAGLGCELQLEFSSRDGQPMELELARLSADSFCPGWSDEDEGVYELAAGTVQLTFVERVPDRTAKTSCIGNARASFAGVIELRSGSKSLSVDLSSLSVSGDFLSQGDTEATCPCLPSCEGRQCGPEPSCGSSCGTCAADDQCNAGGQCVCAPDCEGRQCGDDGCGGSCAPGCGDDSVCNQNTGRCDCVPDCDGRQCGDDGCGGSCGSCQGLDECSAAGSCQRLCPELVFTGNVAIADASQLAALVGYTRVTGDLTIGSGFSASEFVDLSGLECLRTVDGMLQIESNEALTSLVGLGSLESVGPLRIWSNPKLINLQALKALGSATSVYMSGNAALRNLDGLNAITALDTLYVSDSELVSLDGLDGLKSISGTVSLWRNDRLANVQALSQLSSIGYLSLTENRSLASLAPLASADMSALGGLNITDNDALLDLTGLGGIKGEVGSLTIEDNANLASVLTLSGIDSVTRDVSIELNRKLSSLAGLDNLATIGRRLTISRNFQLLNLDPLSALTAVGSHLEVEQNRVLTSVDGLRSLTSLAGELRIRTNADLPTCGAESLRDLLVARGWTATARISGNDDDATCP